MKKFLHLQNNFTNFHNALNNGDGVIVGDMFFEGNNIYIGTNVGEFICLRLVMLLRRLV